MQTATSEASQLSTPARGRWLTSELWLALEVAALTAFAFSRPVLDSFGRSPETFVARRATHLDIVLFALAVALIPALVVAAAGAATRLLGPTTRHRVHLGVVGVLGGLAAWRLGQNITGWPGSATKLQLAGILAAVTLAALRWRVPVTATFLRYAGVASVIFLVQFLVMSPASGLVFGGGGAGGDVNTRVAHDLARNPHPAPVVVVVMDAFPTATLLDGHGHIDAAAFPNLAALARSGTWYRNSTTVSGFTARAVPAIFTGRYPARDGSSAVTGGKPQNLFTLLGGSYDLHVKEQVTRLCPGDLCKGAQGGSLGGLLDDAVGLWRKGNAGAAAGDREAALENMPGITDIDRYAQFEHWIDAQDFSPGGRPDLYAYHLLMPHGPWDTLADGTRYTASAPPTGTFAGVWGSRGLAVGHEREILQAQAADKAVGHLIDRLKQAGIYDDAMVVVTADHGDAFVPREPERGVSRANYEQILWQTLFIKTPHQVKGAINDDNVMTIDIVPTIADTLGVHIPWHVDGRPVRTAGQRDQAVKWFDDDPNNALRSRDGGRLKFDAEAGFAKLLTLRGVTGPGAGAAWRPGPYGDLFGRDVADLEVGSPAGQTVTMTDPTSPFDHVDPAKRLPLEIEGTAHLPVGTHVAYALNGKIGALTTVEPADGAEGPFVPGLLPPKLFVRGANDLTAYVVEGRPGAETLRPLRVAW